MSTTPSGAAGSGQDDEQALDIEALFPADPDLMTSPEGDRRGLRDLRAAARARRDELDRT